MPGGVFATRLDPREDAQCGEHGADDIEYLVSANPGQPPRPLAKVASGRIVADQPRTAGRDAQRHSPACLIFDEVDAGVAAPSPRWWAGS